MTVTIRHGDCREVLRTLPDGSVHCCVTSPPYFGLRDYGVAGQIGLELTPELFVEEMVAVFREVRRVLRDDGTLWLNLGDSYAAQRGGTNMPAETLAGGIAGKGDDAAHRGRGGPFDFEKNRHANKMAHRDARGIGLKHKDLIGIPWRVAFALQADGWYLRQDIIWSKPNPMPESVTDRCTKAHEYLFLLSKSERYYYDQEAVLEDCSPNTHARLSQDVQSQIGSERANGGAKTNGNMKAVSRRGGGNRSHKGTQAYEAGASEHRTKAGLVAFSDKQRKLAEAGSGIKNNGSFDAAMAIMPVKRNPRSVWTVATEPFKEAHFATFPPALIEPCVKAGCPVGGLVLDPFGGAGTTGMVADRLQRDAILIELNPEYAAIADRRIRGDGGMFAEVQS